jgi:hypothetical protein
MNVVRSFCDTFRVFPSVMVMDMFVSTATTPKVRVFMTATCVTICACIYYTSNNPLLAMLLAFLLPEFLIRFLLALAVPH